MSNIIPVEIISEKIFEFRGHKVMIDIDLAKLYGVPTKRLNESVKRNSLRFPNDLMFQLTAAERDELVANYDRFTNTKHSSALPHAFTEAGVAMLSCAELRNGYTDKPSDCTRIYQTPADAKRSRSSQACY